MRFAIALTAPSLMLTSLLEEQQPERSQCAKRDAERGV